MCYSAMIKQNLKSHINGFDFETEINVQLPAFRHHSLEDPKKFPKIAQRIFPGSYAPILFKDSQRGLAVELMRYSAFPPANMGQNRKYTTFNARSDNLTSSFWSNAFNKLHGYIVLDSFFEWVEVADLVKAKVVTIAQITEQFAMQKQQRKRAIEAAGKKYRPTPTEKKNPYLRKTIIQFRPEDGSPLYVPVIASTDPDRFDEPFNKGFAIVTQDPPPEILEAGHDRCPVILSSADLDFWLTTPQPYEAYLNFFAKARRVHFSHKLAPLAA